MGKKINIKTKINGLLYGAPAGSMYITASTAGGREKIKYKDENKRGGSRR